MYFTRLPDHTQPGFDEALHFNKFRKHNIIFHAESKDSHCEDHVGCLSVKTVLSGEETYGVDGRQLVIRPGQFLLLNNDQRYSCRISSEEKVRCLSIFFKNEFAAVVLSDILHREEMLLDDPAVGGGSMPEFFQTLRQITPDMGMQLSGLIRALETTGYNEAMTDEYLVFLLRCLVGVHRSDVKSVSQVKAVKASTRKEVYKRLCIAREVLHASHGENIDLGKIGAQAGLSVPQLVRQFKSVFHTTPYQYLTDIRLKQSAELLRHTDKPVQDIAWSCGFEDAGAFSRAFRAVYGMPPTRFRAVR
ncbi:AraC family transcriptional regulator [Chitinophaga varians]|uniref:AraC family transcriptional regulator n=1 Tax=Chitinophaga varians TaxID=2202339 RepID=UPI00165FADC8|nr:AraC family transcriptional regulator [Chitinophaga varians]MBC9909945.1 helix-turn-helix transcriptional regulator [Chitinophaga varians]